MPGSRSLRILTSMALLLPGVVGAAPELPDLQQRVSVENALVGVSDRKAIDHFVGRALDRCVPSTSNSELCQWNLGNRDPGWRPLARAIGTRDRIALICELPTAGGSRAANSCSAHPRRSNREEFYLQSRGYGGRRAAGAGELRRKRAEHQRLAAAWIDAARTLDQMSRLMGALPDRCVPARRGDQDCRWKASRRVYGQGTLAIWIGASPRKRVRLDCGFELSGASREEPCTAEIGG